MPRPTTGAFRVRDRFEAVEIPPKRMNQSRNARQKCLVSAMEFRPSGLIRYTWHDPGCESDDRYSYGDSRGTIWHGSDLGVRADPGRKSGITAPISPTISSPRIPSTGSASISRRSAIVDGYVREPGFVSGRGVPGFFSGLDTPMLISRNLRPFRNVAARPMSPPPCFAYLVCGCEAGTVSMGPCELVSPLRMAIAAAGRGLSALASNRLTCQICVSFRTSL